MGFNSLQSMISANSLDINLFMLRAQAFSKDLPLLKLNKFLDADWASAPALMDEEFYTESIPVSLLGITANLTPRQVQTLVSLALGKVYKSVAHEMGISPKTVEYHVIEIRRSFGNAQLSTLITELHESGNFPLLQSVAQITMRPRESGL